MAEKEDPPQDLRRLLSRYRKEASSDDSPDIDGQIRLGRATREDDVRSFVTRSTIIAYIVLIAVLLLVSALGVWHMKDMSSWLEEWLSLATQLALPVVTLVLGYYFGSSGRS